LLPRFAAEASDFVADLPEQGGTVALDGQPHFPGDGLVEIHHVARGEANVQDAMQPGMETGYDLAASGGFAAATFTRGDADAAQLEQMVEADLELSQRTRREELIGVDGLGEGVASEAKVFAVHQKMPSSSWVSGPRCCSLCASKSRRRKPAGIEVVGAEG